MARNSYSRGCRGGPFDEDFAREHEQLGLRNILDRVRSARREGSIQLLDDAERECEKLRGEVSHLAGVHWALNAQIAELWSIKGRWKGDLVLLRKGVDELRRYINHLSAGVPQHSRVPLYPLPRDEPPNAQLALALARAQACLGNALARKGYVTRDERDLGNAVSTLLGAARSIGSLEVREPVLWALVQRDLGDAYIGQLAWESNADVDGASLVSLRAAIATLAHALREARGVNSPIANQLEDDLYLTMSCLAVAAILTLQHARGARPNRSRVQAVLEDKNAIRTLGDECMDLVTAVDSKLREVGHHVTTSGPEGMFRWARTSSNLGFACRELWRYRSDPAWFECGVHAFELARKLYHPEDHRFRWAVNEKALGELLFESGRFGGREQPDANQADLVRAKSCLSGAADAFGSSGSELPHRRMESRARKSLAQCAFVLEDRKGHMRGVAASAPVFSYDDASLHEVVEHLRPRGEVEARRRLQALVLEAQGDTPTEPGAQFAEYVNEALDRLGLTISVVVTNKKGVEETKTGRLYWDRSRSRLIINSTKGSVIFKTAEGLELVPRQRRSGGHGPR